MARNERTRSTNIIEFSNGPSHHVTPTRDEAKAVAHAKAKDIAAEWVFSARTKNRLTQAQLGALIGVSGARISQLENPDHRAPVSLEILCEIAHALKISLMFNRSPLKDDPLQPTVKGLSVR